MNHIRKIRYYLCISLLSTILVSVPNLISIFSVWVKEVDNAISKPAVWMACFNSALSPFVYFAFNRDYRNRCFQLVEFHSHSPKVITAYTATTRARNNQFTVTPSER
uniref:G-protein coupled receptors family 1 profile domain-containing protein n=1 Tax=Panagrolaimus superbus TaxID=310955 RepID=A0A914Y160_9BILA